MKVFTIHIDKSIPVNIKAAIGNQIDHILYHCSDHSDIHYSIHEIRKSCKRIRALLRLARDSIGYGTYFSENVFYRDLARRFSYLRDSEVLINSLDALLTESGLKGKNHSGSTLRQHLLEKREDQMMDLFKQEDPFKKIVNDLSIARKRIDYFEFETEDFKTISAGIKRLYRQGKRINKKIDDSSELDTLHLLRKRSKYLQYNIEWIQKIRPELYKGYAKILNEFTDNLGKYRDLLMFIYYLRNVGPGIMKESVKAHFTDLISLKSKQIRDEAVLLGRIIFLESADTFQRKLMACWDIKHKKTKYYEKKN